MTFRVRVLARTYAAQRRAFELWGRVESVLGAFVDEALTVDEKEALGVLLYDASPHYRGTGLFAWEEPWWNRELPRPPARILVGGAGSGREVRELTARGYEVDAFEPAASHLRALRKLSCDVVRVARGSFRDLVCGRDEVARFRRTRYDAVLLGVGSFTHVLTAERRRELLRCLDELCPAGPILASFLARPDDEPTEPRRPTRTQRLGRALASALGSTHGDETRGASFGSHVGYMHRFHAAELHELAAHVGRTVTFAPRPYPHATFRSRPSSSLS